MPIFIFIFPLNLFCTFVGLSITTQKLFFQHVTEIIEGRKELKSKIKQIYRIEIHENWGGNGKKRKEKKRKEKKERTDPCHALTPFSSPFCLPYLNLIP